ncbi:MAG: TRIC cation channel family protein, partial [Pseudonocardia sp.]|nr:TRIC cation channel family protein [Pseudonocardia sp.]
LFALQGGLTAGAAGLDVFGVLVISFVTAVGGGLIRDLLLGVAPPAVFRDVAYPMTVFGCGAVVVLLYHTVSEIPKGVLIPIDAAALGLFAVVGTATAMEHRMSPLLAMMLGTVSAVGGGVLRDVMLDRVPLVLRADVYAVAALAGAGVVAVGLHFRAPRLLILALGAAVCIAIRLVAVWQGWNLPHLSA